MPTPIFVCGAECGIDVRGTLTAAGTEHWSTVLATGTITAVTSGPAVMRSTRCFRFTCASQFARLEHTLASVVASPATIVMRYYIYFASFPTATTDLGHFQGSVSGATGGAVFHAASSEIRNDVTLSGVPVMTGVWYRIDSKAVLAGGAHTYDVQVDGVALTQTTTATAAESVDRLYMGTSVNNTFDFYVDDWVVSATGADYPIGAGTVAGLYPVADGPHQGGWGTGTFGKGAGGATPASITDTDIWQSLDNPLVGTAAGSWVSDLTGTNASDRVVFILDDLPANAVTINGAMFVFTLHSATALASNHSLFLGSTPGGVTIFASTGFNTATITIPVFIRNTGPVGGPWTRDTVNDAQIWFASNDTNPDVYLDGVCMEVDYVPGGFYPYIAPLVVA